MDVVTQFEHQLATFFGAPYAVAVDCATHGIELSLRYTGAHFILCPTRTYLSVPMLASKLNIELGWSDRVWQDYYFITGQVIDAAVLWQRDSYIARTFMSVSFQYQKHLSLGRGGMILCDDQEAATTLKRMSYDGRLPGIPWREQNVSVMGYHYYMTPETAELGMFKLSRAIENKPRQWTINDWPNLKQMDLWKNT